MIGFQRVYWTQVRLFRDGWYWVANADEMSLGILRYDKERKAFKVDDDWLDEEFFDGCWFSGPLKVPCTPPTWPEEE